MRPRQRPPTAGDVRGLIPEGFVSTADLMLQRAVAAGHEAPSRFSGYERRGAARRLTAHARFASR